MQQEPFIFKKVRLEDKELMEEVFRLRYQVYALECNFIKPEDYPDRKESDHLDSQSVHFVAINKDNDVIGTLRMILLGEHPLPIQEHCPYLEAGKGLQSGTYAEISRLVISKNLRRRKNDELYYEPQVEDVNGRDAQNREFMRRAKPMAFGIYRELYQESKRRGITQWYSLMEKSLWLLLRLHGFKFEAIGDELDIYGPVRPYIGKIPIIEQEVYYRFQKFYSYFMENLEKEHQPIFTDAPTSSVLQKVNDQKNHG